MDVTALTVARRPVHLGIYGVEHACLAGREFRRAADVQAAWLDAIELVRTPYFFFIDDDDSLPADHLDVLAQCIYQGAAVAYTDESVNGLIRRSRLYSQYEHLADPLLLHHLVVCETAIALDVARSLPRGHYWPEMQLYWEMAKRGGAAYVPRVGYHWNKGETGLHREWFTVLGIANSRAWCMENQ